VEAKSPSQAGGYRSKGGLPSRSSLDVWGSWKSAFAATPLGETAFARLRERRLVDQNSASWNQIAGWLRQVDLIGAAA